MSSIVIVGVDGSPTAEAAASRAGVLAQALGAELQLACAFEKLEIERIDVGTEEFFFSSVEDAKTTAETVARSLKAELPRPQDRGQGGAGQTCRRARRARRGDGG
ncbi:universal stress protein [Aeromicrobium sp. UC242_57]|uniref:universal stress protein n=1 Tax=Aeromicrobium sp. UC242_57 TaxID=3374624 RepID=UPI0037A80D70